MIKNFSDKVSGNRANNSLAISQFYQQKEFLNTASNPRFHSNRFSSIKSKTVFSLYTTLRRKKKVWSLVKLMAKLMPNKVKDSLFKSVFYPRTHFANTGKFREDFTRSFGISINPVGKATILIPMRNKADLTLSCLSQLSKNSDNEISRIIVIDDESDLDQMELINSIDGIEIIRIEKNVGYLRAINLGLGNVTSKYVVLLNNDTLPQNGWLDSLVNFAEERKELVIAGSRLVGFEGNVQEAGSQIFENDEIWNLGRGLPNDDMRINFNRMVSYNSAASLLLLTSWFKEVGGFDERFVPAYFEDTDICTQAWNCGKEVWYVHDSVVFHLEGGTHGTSVLSGLKSYQEINKVKFFNKWKIFPYRKFNIEEVSPGLFERDLTSKGIIVFADDQIPDPLRDHGSKRADQIFTELQELGFHVVLLCLNNNVDRRVLSYHLRKGIEIYSSLDELAINLASRKSRVRYVWVARENVAKRFWDDLKNQFENTPFIFDTVDLVHLRIDRQGKVNGWRNKKINAFEVASIRRSELNFISASDMSIVVSDYEKSYLSSIHGIPDKVTTLWAWEPFELGPTSEPSNRELITFVGSFKHEPNVDAIQWLIESIVPVLKMEDSSLIGRICVVGAALPPEIQQSLKKEGISYRGWVPDLSDIYKNTRVAFAPLRFGAGMKGKILEAISFGCPVVTTSIGVEGFPLEHNRDIFVSDYPEELAQLLVSAYNNTEVLNKIAGNSMIKIKNEFSHARFKERLVDLLVDTTENFRRK